MDPNFLFFKLDLAFVISDIHDTSGCVVLRRSNDKPDPSQDGDGADQVCEMGGLESVVRRVGALDDGDADDCGGDGLHGGVAGGQRSVNELRRPHVE